jgi:putative NIF3 family GTP cyclohydrolase 1 type 2
MGTFKAGPGTEPYVGKKGSQHQEKELKIEIIFPAYLEQQLIVALRSVHPYEEVAYDIVALSNTHAAIGSGIMGELAEELEEKVFLQRLKDVFQLKMIRHTALLNKPVKKIAVCGGAGSFLIPKVLAAGADAYITSDIKYHEFFDANSRLLLADIGHYESEQFTINLLQEILEEKFPTFAVLKTTVKTNPVFYY